MKREEERIKQIEKFAFECYEDGERYSAFISGAIWADNNPINVWHLINEEPKINEDVVLYDSCGNLVTEFYNGDVTWNNIVFYHKVSMWAYISDLFPKGGEQ